MQQTNALDDLSECLLLDERVLQTRERKLLLDLLQRLKTSTSADSPAGVQAIARAMGELLSERAWTALGQRLGERLLTLDPGGNAVRSSEERGLLGQVASMQRRSLTATGPKPSETVFEGPKPSGPLPAGPKPSPQPAGPKPPAPAPTSQSTAHSFGTATPVTDIADEATGEIVPCVVFEEFLASQELDALTKYVLEREKDFRISEVVSPGVPGSEIDYERRRSRVLMDFGDHQEMIVGRIRPHWRSALQRLGLEDFPIKRWEAQVTASNDGDFFRWHTDNGQPEIVSRAVTFVYFFHREPKPFTGGELRIYNPRLVAGQHIPTSTYRVIVPEQNQLVMFSSFWPHEVTPVKCPSGAFADSRFTVNGWFHR